jgi:hypothetical protein
MIRFRQNRTDWLYWVATFIVILLAALYLSLH